MENRFNNIIDYILTHRVVAHVLYWLALFFGALVYGQGMGEMWVVSVIFELIHLPFQIVATYVFIYWQLPLLYKKKYWVFGLLFLFIAYIFVGFIHINNDYGIGTMLSSWHKPHNLIEILTLPTFYLRYFVDLYVVVFITTIVKLIKDHFESRSLLEHLKTEKTKSEYVLLQRQVQPQFLLRSVGMIRDLSVSSPEKVPDLISSLADLLSYNLYQSKDKRVSIDHAFEKMKTYAVLYANGVGNLSKVDTQIAVTTPETMLPPSIFIHIAEAVLDQYHQREIEAQHVLIILNQEEVDKVCLTFQILDTKESNAEVIGDLMDKFTILDHLKQRVQYRFDIVIDGPQISFNIWL